MRSLIYTFAFLGLLSVSVASFGLNIFMAPNGNDANNGATITSPVATLKRATELANELSISKQELVQVLVHGGIYRGQSVMIDGDNHRGNIKIIGQSDNGVDLPVFLGDGSVQTWLTLKASKARSTGLSVEALEIRGYFTAISLEGNRNDVEAFNANTTIRYNIFRNIGSIAVSEDDAISTAALRFINSRSNIVEYNKFIVIRNKKRCSSLHALYIAHFSSDNHIANNIFDDACGASIKLRDRSNDNYVNNNTFIRIENSPAIQEWFCDMKSRADCTKKLGECPSTGNFESNNALTNSGRSMLISVAGNTIQRAWCSLDDFERNRVISN